MGSLNSLFSSLPPFLTFSVEMADIKFTYFDLRVKGEAARLLLAYSGEQWVDNRLTKPWIDPKPWTALKPTYPWGQVPCLEYKGESYFQSMAICRFLARELGIAGKCNMEAARVDEIVDAIQDAVDATLKYTSTQDKKKLLTDLTTVTYPDVLSKLEKRLKDNGGQWFAGNNLTWADLHLYFFAGTGDYIEPDVLWKYPTLANLVYRVEALPNVAKWMKIRPPNGDPIPDLLIFFKNPYKILAEDSSKL